MDHIARVCKALGDPTRLRIYSFLLECCCPVAVGEQGEVRPADGPTVGEVCCQVTGIDKITSTLSFHLKELREAGLITMTKRGKHMVCGIERETLAKVSAFFKEANDKGSGCC